MLDEFYCSECELSFYFKNGECVEYELMKKKYFLEGCLIPDIQSE